MATFRRSASVTLVPTTGDQPWLDVISGSVSLNETTQPYATATVEVAIPDMATIALMDPRTGPRITLTLSDFNERTQTLTERSFDLLVIARSVDHDAKSVTLQAVSDDQDLLNYSLVQNTTDTTNVASQHSVRQVVQNVLTRVNGATLQPGSADADFTTLTALTNYVTNGNFEDSTTSGWAGGNANLTQSTVWARSGTHSLSIGPNSTSSGDSYASAAVTNFTAGNQYTISAWHHLPTPQNSSAAGSRPRSIVVVANGAVLTQSAQAPNSAGDTRLSVTFTLPINTTTLSIRLYNGGTSGSTITYWDQVLMTDGTGLETDGTPLQYFDGDTADTNLYEYAWQGTNGASPSTRVPVFDRPPESLTWSPGDSASDYLESILTAVGLRLYCDEQRRWWLADGTFQVPGLLRIATGYNLYAASDAIDSTATAIDGTPLFFEAAVVTYSWTNAAGNAETAYDAYALPGVTVTNTLRLTLQRAYPGPGAAQYMVTRNSGRGHSLNLTARQELSATPSMPVSVTLPNSDQQAGWISGISWDLSTNEMTVSTRGLIAYPAGSYGHAATNQTYASVSSTYAAYAN
ncbi:carbohydrate binding domain-containing protein [Curtobacterium sp. MCBD17_040]|uniref:carbohydrate binding domain-containing protein n=1 Tax=Curtobacterium sp. MCBD17_040 TaxID=2175674 RepID=UPI0015E8C540|nr:carbohydrate binding domain-containing protein [Curtobacterium sp. MCBD17_040]WIB64365.1 carbohydrate binding domain-containing protein [Curtobacterium sp. MCBD17_040]